MKWIVSSFAALLVFSLARFAIQRDRLRVKQDSIIAWAGIHAKSVGGYYAINHRFPRSKAELTEYIFGDPGSNFTFVVVNETQRDFTISAPLEPNRIVQIGFRLSSTGLVQTAPVITEK